MPLRNSIHFIHPISTVMIQSGVPYRRSHGIQCKLTVSTRAWRTSARSSSAHQRYGRRRPALNPRAPTRASPSPIDGHYHMKQVGGRRRAPSAERIGTAAATTRGNGSAAALAPAVVISRWGGRRKRPRRGSAAYPTRAARRSSAVLLPPPPQPATPPPAAWSAPPVGAPAVPTRRGPTQQSLAAARPPATAARRPRRRWRPSAAPTLARSPPLARGAVRGRRRRGRRGGRGGPSRRGAGPPTLTASGSRSVRAATD